MTTDEMKAELIAAGYEFVDYQKDGEGGYYDAYIQSPDGLMFVWNHDNNCIQDAYTHLQEKRERDALRVFVWEMWGTAKKMPGTEPALTIFTKADKLIEQFSITHADDDSDISEATRDRLADIYNDESEDDE